MSMLNNTVCVKPLQIGPLSSSDSNEYEVLDSVEHNPELADSPSGPPWRVVHKGEIIVVREDAVIRTIVKGVERFYVKEEDILEVFDGPDKNN